MTVSELAPAMTAFNPVLVPLLNGRSGTAGARPFGGLDVPPPRPDFANRRNRLKG